MFDYGYVFVFLTVISIVILYAHVTDNLILTRYSDRDKIGLFIIALLLLPLSERFIIILPETVAEWVILICATYCMIPPSFPLVMIFALVYKNIECYWNKGIEAKGNVS